MGQYFCAVLQNADERKVVWPNGLKLMEHSWVGNSFMARVCKYIQEHGYAHVAWMGDYAKSESLAEGFFDEHKTKMLLDMYEASWTADHEDQIDSADEWEYRYGGYWLLNMDKNECIYVNKKNRDWTVHPLAPLTCSNPGSGGNYHPHSGEEDEKYFCSWCGDKIGFRKTKPRNCKVLNKDMFYENW